MKFLTLCLILSTSACAFNPSLDEAERACSAGHLKEYRIAGKGTAAHVKCYDQNGSQDEE